MCGVEVEEAVCEKVLTCGSKYVHVHVLIAYHVIVVKDSTNEHPSGAVRISAYMPAQFPNLLSIPALLGASLRC